MISTNQVNRVKPAVCAITRHDMPHEEYFKLQPRNNVKPPHGQVIGTGFLINYETVITNTHVVDPIAAEYQETESLSHWYLEFLQPDENGTNWTRYAKRIKGGFKMLQREGALDVDFGMIRFNNEENSISSNHIIELGSLDSIKVGNGIGICGYPLGSEMLKSETIKERFGPVIHEGIISAVSPFETSNTRDITSFLTDLNTAPGMSGSPIFLKENGLTIGLHFAGVQGTLGVAIPIDSERVDHWLRLFDEAREHKPNVYEFTSTVTGDPVKKLQCIRNEFIA